MLMFRMTAREMIHKRDLRHQQELSDAKILNNELLSKEKIEFNSKYNDLKTDYEKKLLEFKSQYENEVNRLKTAHAKELSEFKSKTAGEYYERLKDEFTDLQKEGDKNSKFVQELALKIMEKAPPSTTKKIKVIENKEK